MGRCGGGGAGEREQTFTVAKGGAGIERKLAGPGKDSAR